MLKTLFDQLGDPSPEARIEALCALVMLEETEALPLLTQMWSTETHPEVKQAVGWAGKQIHAAQQRGYTTIEGMAAALRVHLVPDEKDIEEKRKLSQIQTNINVQHAKQYGDDESNRRVGNALKGAAIAGALGAIGGLGTGAILGAMSPNVGPSTTLGGGDKPSIGKETIVPPRPSDANIAPWVKRMAEADPKTRRAAIIQLRDFNNPRSLGPLGTRFVKDPDPALKDMAQQTGKQIYFSALYWQDHDDPQKATLKAKEIAAKAEAAKQKRATQQ